MEHELTEDELGLISCAIEHPGFPPKPEYLPECERLVDRGWLNRKLIGGYVTFWLTNEGAAALELAGAIEEAQGSTN